MSKTLGGYMQVWDITREGDGFSFKVVYKEQSIEQFVFLIGNTISIGEKKEYWLVEEDSDGVFHIKSKFKWGGH